MKRVELDKLDLKLIERLGDDARVSNREVAREFGLIVSISAGSPVVITYLLQQLPADRVARALSAWSVSSSLAIAGLTALWGVLATVTGPRVAIGIAGALLLATPLLLPGWRKLPDGEQLPAGRQLPATLQDSEGNDQPAVDEQVDAIEEARAVG